MKVALIHHWLVNMRGGEKVLESFCRLYPDADIFTHVYNPNSTSDLIKRHTIKTTLISRLPNAGKNYKKYLALMPLALEQIDLRGYDLIISIESGPAKGIIPPPNAVHICYCNSPMRYIWHMYHEYRARAGFLTRLLMPVLSHYVRNWDAISSMRVDHFIANSQTVAARITKYYRRESTVIHPPVDLDAFEMVSADQRGSFYLMVGELVAYKRPELAVEAFNRSGRQLVVIGGGEMFGGLLDLAGPTVTMLGPQPFDVLRHHYARCQALIFPGEEDFGIVPLEVMASGRPVIAFGRGGVTETVIPQVTGVFFEHQTIEAIEAAVAEAESLVFDPDTIRRVATAFRTERFEAEIRHFIDKALDQARSATNTRSIESGSAPGAITEASHTRHGDIVAEVVEPPGKTLLDVGR